MPIINSEFSLKVIGVMSGTSLDGLDFCFVQFTRDNNHWKYRIHKTETEPYPIEIKEKLSKAHLMDAFSYALFNSEYGIYIGKKLKSFIEKNKIKPDLIASHGHTIFHQPSKRFTAQIGSGASIAAETGVNTVCDFRAMDVALYGQGAPLVPIGDRYLFSDYDYCLNLGGFSNISFERNKKRIAFDISPVNYVLNHYMKSIGKDYDKNGSTARSGKINSDLLIELNNLSYYKQSAPKSLSRENVEDDFIPLIDNYIISVKDKLATFCEHIAIQINNNVDNGKVLITGGGAFNKFLIERIKANSSNCDFVIPDDQTVKFKEALIFAFLGALYYYDKPNCLSSVTGAKYDSIGGALYKAVQQD